MAHQTLYSSLYSAFEDVYCTSVHWHLQTDSWLLWKKVQTKELTYRCFSTSKCSLEKSQTADLLKQKKSLLCYFHPWLIGWFRPTMTSSLGIANSTSLFYKVMLLNRCGDVAQWENAWFARGFFIGSLLHSVLLTCTPYSSLCDRSSLQLTNTPCILSVRMMKTVHCGCMCSRLLSQKSKTPLYTSPRL